MDDISFIEKSEFFLMALNNMTKEDFTPEIRPWEIGLSSYLYIISSNDNTGHALLSKFLDRFIFQLSFETIHGSFEQKIG